jgi:hypothetical protein
VIRFPIRPACVLAVCAAWVVPLAAQRWQMQYSYDKIKSSLAIVDMQFPSASRGVAVGYIEEGRRRKPISLVTADGGTRWALVPLKEAPISLFFLNENAGWMVTDEGLWETREAGRSWRKLPSARYPLLRVLFTDEKHGWAACARKVVLETADGGRHWTRVEAASQPPGDPKYSAYSWISFPTPNLGIITGWNRPPQWDEPQLPGWLDPEATLDRRETPHLSLSLETTDGGKTWRPSSSSAFGMITRLRFLPMAWGLGLIEYSASFKYPSEVFRISTGGRSESVYRDSKFAVSDVWLDPDGTAYLAGAVHPGRLRVVPGRVQVLKSSDLKVWSAMEADYRALATRTVLAAAGGSMWLATDTGMILKLAP